MLIKKYILPILMFMPVLASAQKAFRITGSSKGFAEGDRIFLAYKENGKFHLDSTTVKNGAFAFNGTINSFGVGYMSRNDNPQYADLMDDTSPVYIEAGNIQLNSVDSLIHATVSGTPLNNDQTELTLALASLYKKRRLVTQTFDALEADQKADTKYTDKLRMTSDSLDKLMEPIKFAFIKSHPNSYVSVITLNGLVNHTDLTLVADAYSALSHASKTTALGKAMGVTIASAKRSQIGVMAANFELNTSAGKKLKLASYKGKYVLVDFWASWCSPCRAENPNVVAAYEKYRSKNFSVVSISIDGKEDRKAWLAAIKKDKLPWVQAVDNYGPIQKVKDLYGVTTIPANVLIDPTGKIVAKNIRGQELHDTLEKMLK